MGWNITGLSEISAVNHVRHYDGSTISGVSLNRNDAYALDGQRLLLVSSQNGSYGAEYTTEEECWSKIVIDSAFSQTPKSFLIKKSDGSVYRYGSTETSLCRFPSTSSESVFCWQLDTAEDLYGNNIQYSYTYYNNIPQISEIRYGGNTKTSAPSSYIVEFLYEQRPDTVLCSIKSETYCNTNRLKYVICKVNDHEYRRYTLTYDNTSYYSHLISVKETGTDGLGFPETVFDWADLPLQDNIYKQFPLPPFIK